MPTTRSDRPRDLGVGAASGRDAGRPDGTPRSPCPPERRGPRSDRRLARSTSCGARRSRGSRRARRRAAPLAREQHGEVAPHAAAGATLRGSARAAGGARASASRSSTSSAHGHVDLEAAARLGMQLADAADHAARRTRSSPARAGVQERLAVAARGSSPRTPSSSSRRSAAPFASKKSGGGVARLPERLARAPRRAAPRPRRLVGQRRRRAPARNTRASSKSAHSLDLARAVAHARRASSDGTSVRAQARRPRPRSGSRGARRAGAGRPRRGAARRASPPPAKGSVITSMKPGAASASRTRLARLARARRREAPAIAPPAACSGCGRSRGCARPPRRGRPRSRRSGR